MPFHPSNHWIMVGKTAFFIHAETIWIKVFCTHHIVNSNIHAISMICETRSLGCRYIAVHKVFRYSPSGIAQRYIIKVSADNHGTALVHPHKACYGFCLRSPDCRRCTKFPENCCFSSLENLFVSRWLLRTINSLPLTSR